MLFSFFRSTDFVFYHTFCCTWQKSSTIIDHYMPVQKDVMTDKYTKEHLTFTSNFDLDLDFWPWPQNRLKGRKIDFKAHFISIWSWPLTYDLDLQTQSSQGQDWPSCKKSRSKVNRFKSSSIHGWTDGCYLECIIFPASRSIINKWGLYADGYSSALVLDHRSTAYAEIIFSQVLIIKHGEIWNLRPNKVNYSIQAKVFILPLTFWVWMSSFGRREILLKLVINTQNVSGRMKTFAWIVMSTPLTNIFGK